MSAAVVASVVIGKKNEAETGDADADGPNDPLAFKEALNPRTQVFMRKEDDLLRRQNARAPSEKLMDWVADVAPGERSKRSWVLKEIKERCRLDRSKREHYCNLFGFLIFTSLYILMLYWQRDPTTAYYVTEIFADFTPQQDNGEPQQPFAAWGDVKDWFMKSIVEASWTDPDCGDNICQSFEYAAWGHEENLYGCLADCGYETKVTKVHVILDHTFITSEPLLSILVRAYSGWARNESDTENSALGTDHDEFETDWQVRWNLCTAEMRSRRCWFKEPQVISPGAEKNWSMDVPDEDWTLVIQEQDCPRSMRSVGLCEVDTGGHAISPAPKYVQGRIVAEGPAGRVCNTMCDASDMCAIHCKGDGEAASTGSAAATSTDAYSAGNSTGYDTILHAFTVCAPNPIAEGGAVTDATWRHYVERTASPTVTLPTTLSPSATPTSSPTAPTVTPPTTLSPSATPTSSPTAPTVTPPTTLPPSITPTAPATIPDPVAEADGSDAATGTDTDTDSNADSITGTGDGGEEAEGAGYNGAAARRLLQRPQPPGGQDPDGYGYGYDYEYEWKYGNEEPECKPEVVTCESGDACATCAGMGVWMCHDMAMLFRELWGVSLGEVCEQSADMCIMGCDSTSLDDVLEEMQIRGDDDQCFPRPEQCNPDYGDDGRLTFDVMYRIFMVLNFDDPCPDVRTPRYAPPYSTYSKREFYPFPCNMPTEYVGKRFDEVCPMQCCTSPAECKAASGMTLADGRFMWEGRVQIQWAIDPAGQFDSSFSHSDSVSDDLREFSATILPLMNIPYYGDSYLLTMNQDGNARSACMTMGYEGVIQSYLVNESESTRVPQDYEEVSDLQGNALHSLYPTNVSVGSGGALPLLLPACEAEGDYQALWQCERFLESYYLDKASETIDYRTVANGRNIDDIFDDFFIQEISGSIQSNITLAVQCFPGLSTYSNDVCNSGLVDCCAPGCFPAENAVTNWTSKRFECKLFNGNDCGIALYGDGVCNPECDNPACQRDGWDCCNLRQVLDAESGNSDSCCEPVVMDVSFRVASFGGPRQQRKDLGRYIGANRFVGGAMLFQKRREFEENNKRFGYLYPYYLGGYSKTPYGLNPYFLETSNLYDESLNKTELYPGVEVVSHENLTAFDYVDLSAEGFGAGFPLVFSIALDAGSAQDLHTYMSDGHYFDDQTEELIIQLVMYNGEVDMFSSIHFEMTKTGAGSIVWSYSNSPINVNLYDSMSDKFRLGIEILYIIFVLFSASSEMREAIDIYKKTGAFRGYFASAANYVDVLSIMCNVVTILLYGLMAHRASIFEIDLVDDYYVSSMWGRKMLDLPRIKELAESFYQLNNIGTMQQLYISICGANMFLFLLRIFKLLDFQPKMGILTRTMSNAMSDLMHFFVLLTLVLMMYVCMGTIIFGPTMHMFHEPVLALRTTMDMMFGEFGDTEQELFSREVARGYLNLPAVLFFYSFMMIVFLVILNFLLAIIVDSFTDVKSSTGEHDESMFAELAQMGRNTAYYVWSGEYRAKHSRRAIEALVNRLREKDKEDAQVDDNDDDENDDDDDDSILEGVPAVEMQDEKFRVLLTDDLLNQVLKSVKAHEAPREHEQLATAVLKTFGHEISVDEAKNPVLVKDTDEVGRSFYTARAASAVEGGTEHTKARNDRDIKPKDRTPSRKNKTISYQSTWAGWWWEPTTGCCTVYDAHARQHACGHPSQQNRLPFIYDQFQSFTFLTSFALKLSELETLVHNLDAKVDTTSAQLIQVAHQQRLQLQQMQLLISAFAVLPDEALQVHATGEERRTPGSTAPAARPRNCTPRSRSGKGASPLPVKESTLSYFNPVPLMSDTDEEGSVYGEQL